jgi:thiamine-monophosphate kinase
MPRLRETGEFAVIRRLVEGLRPGSGVHVGPGDDAAVLRPEPGRDLVITTDAFVEGRHWLPDWIEPGRLGVRLALANLSDLAAMAARPRWALLSLGLRGDTPSEWVEALQAGLVAALERDGASVVGGNLAAVEGEAWLSLTLAGDVLPGHAWTRRGARAGDLLAVTGTPGRAGAAVALIHALGEGARAPEWAPLLAAWRTPASRVDLARALAASGAITAAVDISDGWAGDLVHLCEASGVGAEVQRGAWSADAALDAAAHALGRTPDDFRTGPSDDYELLLAIDPAGRERCAAIALEAGVPLSVIGRLTGPAEALEWLEKSGSRTPIEPRGFDHFA